MTLGLSKAVASTTKVAPPTKTPILPHPPHLGDRQRQNDRHSFTETVTKSRNGTKESGETGFSTTGLGTARLASVGRLSRLRWLSRTEFQDFSDAYLQGVEAGYRAAQALFEQGQIHHLLRQCDSYTTGHQAGWTRYLQEHC